MTYKDNDMDDLNGIVAAAIHLHDQERELGPWEAVVEQAEARLADATPAEIGRLCTRIASVHASTDWAFRASCDIHAEIRNRADRGTDIPGGTALLLEQRDDADRLGTRLTDLRGRLRRLYGTIGDALSKLRDQRIDERLMRIAADDAIVREVGELDELVRADHHAIADAIGDWRTMYSRGPMMLIAGSSTAAEIGGALRHLERTGEAMRSRSLLGGPRWTLRRSTARLKAA